MSRRELFLVDDEQQILKAYREVFPQAGYDVRTAASAEEALEMLQEKPAWVLFLDLNLPGMNGLELCRQIREDWPMAISYAVTGYASDFEKNACRREGFEDYFIKPVRISLLLRAAEHAFGKLDRWNQS